MIAILIHALLYVNSRKRRPTEPGMLEYWIAVDAFITAAVLCTFMQRFH